MLNVICLMGRLVADPELRHTPNGIATCTFRIAVDRNFARQGKSAKPTLLTLWPGARAPSLCAAISTKAA